MNEVFATEEIKKTLDDPYVILKAVGDCVEIYPELSAHRNRKDA